MVLKVTRRKVQYVTNLKSNDSINFNLLQILHKKAYGSVDHSYQICTYMSRHKCVYLEGGKLESH